VSIKRPFFAVILLIFLTSTLHAQMAGAPTWKIYYDSAQTFWNSDWPKTISLLARAEKSALSDLGIYDDNYLTIVNDLALAYTHTNDYSTAEKLFTKIIATRTELGNISDSEYTNAVMNLANVYAETAKVKQAAALYKKLMSSSTPETPDHQKAGESLLRLYESNDQLDSAMLVANKLKSQARANDDNTAFELTLAQGRLNRKLRKYDEAKTILEYLAHTLQSQLNHTSLYLRSLQELALVSQETGFLNNAEKYLLQCFRQLKSGQGKDEELLIEVLNNLASTYERLNINDKALIYYQEALTHCKQLNGPNDVSTLTVKNNIAGIHLSQGGLSKAIASYEEIAKSLHSTSKASTFYITILNNLGTAYRKSNQYQKAGEHLNEAMKLIAQNKLEKEDIGAGVLNNIAVLHTALGEPEKAITYFERAYAIKQTLYGENSLALMDLAGNMAVLYWALKRSDTAIPLFRKSIAMAIRQIRYIFPNLSEDEQVQFYQKTKEDFERFNAIAFEASTQHPDLLRDVFNNQVVVKSILFFTQQHRQLLINEKRDSVLRQQYELMRSKREQLGRFYQLSLKDLATAETSASSLEKEIDQLEKAISLKTSETVSEKMMERELRWEDIQKNMASDQALIELIRVRTYDLKTFVENNADRVRFGFTDSVNYGALLTTSSTTTAPQLVLIKDGNNMEMRFLHYYRNALAYGVEDNNSYASYWKPIEPFLTNKSRIYLSGDGVYHRLNLNTIRHATTGEYLLQRYDIHYLLNPGQFIQEKITRASSKKAVLFGDPVFEASASVQSKNGDDNYETFQPLPGTQKEVVKINDILKSNGWTSNVFLHKTATEKNVKAVHSPDLLHIATHGFFSVGKVRLTAEAKKDFLFYSGLVFAGANNNITEEKGPSDDDGILTAFEVMYLDLSSTKLVVLSACETGLGRIENGEGVFGLQRSFLQAGARNVMISLWKVDDVMTQVLMGQFYHYLFKGHPVRTALKLAQLDQLKKHPDPYGWGGFVIVGVD